jgi:hypothetical protein
MLGKDAERTVGGKTNILWICSLQPCPCSSGHVHTKKIDFVGWMLRNRQMWNNNTAVPCWVGHADSKRVPFEALRR